MGTSSLLTTALAVLAYQTGSARADDGATTASICDASFTGSSVCLASFTTTSSVTFSVAIPDAAAAPFDTLLHIVAPATTGWAGLAWGGAMAANPLTVAWPSGDGAIVSSRWATGHTLPAAYAGASYQTLASSKNATHWELSVLCSGCSQWSSAAHALNPAAANTLAWASSTRAVTTPSSNTSTFAYHTGRGTVSVDLSAARVPQAVFEQYVAFLSKGSDQASAPAAPPPAPPASSSSAAPPPAPPASSSPAAPPASSSATNPTTTIRGSNTHHASSSTTAAPVSAPPAPVTVVSGSETTIISTVYITVGSPSSAQAPSSSPAIPPSRPSTIVTPPFVRPHEPTRLPPWAPSPLKPVPTGSSSSVGTGDAGDDSEPTVTVTVIDGGAVPTAPAAGPPVFGGKKGPFRPPFRRPPFLPRE